MDLLSEVRTPQQVLNFAINRERGQTNQQEILKAHTNNTSWSKVLYIRNKARPPNPQRTLQQPILPTPPTGKIELCYKCGQPFIKNHLNMCKAQNFTCKICKKIGHFISKCRTPMPERRNPQFRKDYRKNPQQQSTNQTRRVQQAQCKRTSTMRRRRRNRRGNSRRRSRTLNRRANGRLVISEHDKTNWMDQNKQHIIKQRSRRRILGRNEIQQHRTGLVSRHRLA